LWHYSATELITAGVDIRTVAGRLSHDGGGTTTLKVYAASVTAAHIHWVRSWCRSLMVIALVLA
jgi:site-specific recombinase XerD